MQPTFPCSKCGSHNFIGQPFCQNCGQQFQYNCPSCRAFVDSRFSVCPNCRAPLNWPAQQQIQPPPAYQQNASYQQTQVEPKKKKRNPWLLGCLIPLGIVAILAVVGFIASSGSHEIAPSTTQNPPVLVTKDASQLVLAVNDFESGWTRTIAASDNTEGAQSAYRVNFVQGSSVFPTVIQNTTAVYPSIDLAKQAYIKEKPENVSLAYPQIGDECFLNESIPQVLRLVFRRSNVVVWVQVVQGVSWDAEDYAKIIDKKIIQ